MGYINTHIPDDLHHLLNDLEGPQRDNIVAATRLLTTLCGDSPIGDPIDASLSRRQQHITIDEVKLNDQGRIYLGTDWGGLRVRYAVLPIDAGGDHD